MKIGYVHPNPFPSSLANIVQIVQMCRTFGALGHAVTLFVPRSREFDSDAAAREQARAQFGDPLPFEIVFVRRKTVLGRGEVLGSVRETIRALREYPQDLIYTRNPWSVPFLPRAGIPFVFESHDAHLHATSRILGMIMRSLIVRTSYNRRMLKLVAISEALRKVWRGYGVPETKLLAAHDAVDPELFESKIDKQEARAQLKLPVDKPVVLYTGTLKEDRGIELIIAAAQRLPELHFCVVGGSQQEADRLRGMAVRLSAGNMLFKSRIPHHEIPLWQSAADILLMMWTWKVPTIRVCSPMKLFEYMAAERLIVGPAFPTIKEVLVDGKDAILFEPDNLEAMISALEDAQVRLDDSSLPRAARAKVLAEYTWQARCERILAALADQLKQ